MGYQHVKDRLDHGHRKIANNTYLEQLNGHITMKLHGHTVARFYEHYLQLYCAGYYTKITRDRLNMALRLASIPLPGHIAQVRDTWYYYHHKLRLPFAEGMKIDYNGVPLTVEED